MIIIVILGSIAAGLCIGGFVAFEFLRRQREEQAAAADQTQSASVEAAVRQVLLERGATAQATARAVVADREATVSAAVDNAVKVAQATLEAKLNEGSKELDLRSSSFATQVQSITAQLDKVQGLVGQLQKDKAHQHGQLVTQLENAATHTRELHDTTSALRDVLASPKARGQWGERMAEDVLQAAGFRDGINYRKQQAMPGGGVPDFTFLLPRGLHLNMDVKFPVDNYVRYLEAPDDSGTRQMSRCIRSRCPSANS